VKKIKLWTGIILLSAGFFLSAYGTTLTLFDTNFSGPSALVNGSEGWLGRDSAILLNGSGMASLMKGSDSFVKHPLLVPDYADQIRISAKMKFSGTQDSVMANYGKDKEAWIALGVMNNSSADVGLVASKLSISVSSDGQQLSIGLGSAVGPARPSFGVVLTAGNASFELALDYNFISGVATALLNGKPVLTGNLQLTKKDFSFVGFQLRQVTQDAGVDDLKVEFTGSLGSRTNAQTLRAHEIENSIDSAKTADEIIAALKLGWKNPPATYRPHTRWWWPGNAVTKEGIDFQLQEMKDKGLGGVEIMSYAKVYKQGNIDFNSDKFVEMTKYAVDKARWLGMEVTPALTPGWNHGHALVPEEDGSKAMIYYEADINGGNVEMNLRDMESRETEGWAKNPKRRFDALIAVALKDDGTPDTTHRIDLTLKVTSSGKDQFTTSPDIKFNGILPVGRWRLMSFWTALTGQICAFDINTPKSTVVDHLNRGAVERYLKNATRRFDAVLGRDYGQTVDSFFGDSWEIAQGFSFWSTGLYDRFEKEKGYDLRPYLPMLVYDGAPKTPYVRYDVGSFLSKLGMESIVRPLANNAGARSVQMRQQPHYRFPSDIIEQSGVLQRPETENTKRSFDPMFWHKLTTSGAWLYPSQGRKWVSSEAFTFNNEKYRSTMEELKRGTDLFLRDGITQFYNHGYFYTPEKELAPSRDLYWGNRISHVNTWWPWYKGLADYQARAAYLSRQGRPESNVLVYASYPTSWSERAKFPAGNVRDLPLGVLTKILIANGYDFDTVNDDLLLRYANIRNGKIIINGFDYSVLILPRTIVLAPEVLEKIAEFVKSGGTVMALRNLPIRSAGLANFQTNDKRLSVLRNELFGNNGVEKKVEKGSSWYFKDFDGLEYMEQFSAGALGWSETPKLSSQQQKFINALRSSLTPDFEIEGKSQSDGLTFRHTKIGPVDSWFICNLQPTETGTGTGTKVTLNTKNKIPQKWNAMTGAIESLDGYSFAKDGRVEIPVDLQPWESMFVILTPGTAATAQLTTKNNSLTSMALTPSSATVTFTGLGNFSEDIKMKELVDWSTDDKHKKLQNFSGTAVYKFEFNRTNQMKPKFILDLGKVHDVASVKVNGEEAGKVWMQPYRLDISKKLIVGTNKLEITVANLLWNYAFSLSTQTEIPQEFQSEYGNADADPKVWNKFQEIKDKRGGKTPSGLLGPVQLWYAPKE